MCPDTMTVTTIPAVSTIVAVPLIRPISDFLRKSEPDSVKVPVTPDPLIVPDPVTITLYESAEIPSTTIVAEPAIVSVIVPVSVSPLA